MGGPSMVKVDTSAALNGSSEPCGVRYSWAPVSDGLFLYNSAGLPASPFLARCNATDSSCSLVPPGQVPGPPTPPTPPPTPSTLPPYAPLPPNSKCTFANETVYDDATYKKIDVDLWDYETC